MWDYIQVGLIVIATLIVIGQPKDTRPDLLVLWATVLLWPAVLVSIVWKVIRPDDDGEDGPAAA